MNPIRIAAAALLLSAAPAWAINKCVGPDGRAVFQDAPCAGAGGEIVVKPASGLGAPPALPDQTASGAPPMTPAQRMDAQSQKTWREWRRRDLENAIARNAANCNKEQDALRTSKAHAKNNLAGATWEQSISQEMSAAAARCDTRQRQLQHELDELRKIDAAPAP